MGSVMEALYYQVPMLTAPQVHEQSVNADRVVQLGLGRRLDIDTPTPAQLRERIERLIADTSIRTGLASMREVLRAAGGADAGAAAIEDHLA
jgi:UDP:flavonoid glycosyltransferase YjiC (YdhE family)